MTHVRREIEAVNSRKAEADLLSMLNEMTFQSVATRSGTPRRIAERYSLGTPAGPRSEAGDSPEPYLHIFNFENEEGFAILSGDERVPSLLTLTCGGSLRPDREIDNPGLAIFLERLPAYYEQQIALADSIHQAISDSLRLVAEQQPRTRAKVGSIPDDPVITTYFGSWEHQATPTAGLAGGRSRTHWHQGEPFNSYIPTKIGQQAKVGCVPVAVGQLMAMYKHPASYNGYTFDWDGMNQRTPSPASIDQAAWLLSRLSLPENLDTKDGASPVANIKRTLNNFGYTSSDKLSYSTDGVVAEILNGYPCLVGGKNKAGVGHRWVVDHLERWQRVVTEYYYYPSSGNYPKIPPLEDRVFTYYQTMYYLHCNMGWGGTGDGYYAGGVFDTDAGPHHLETRNSSRNL